MFLTSHDGPLDVARLVAGPTFLPDKAISYQNPYVIEGANRCFPLPGSVLATNLFSHRCEKAEVLLRQPFIPPLAEAVGLPERKQREVVRSGRGMLPRRQSEPAALWKGLAGSQKRIHFS